MKLSLIEIHPPTVQLGRKPARERFASDGPLHVEMLGESLVAVWDDEVPDEALLFHWTRIKRAVIDKDELLAMLTEPVQNGVAGAAAPAAEVLERAATGVVKAGKR